MRAYKKYKKRYGSYDKRGSIKDRISIHERPEVVSKKERVGDWEGDTVLGLGRKNAFITMVDRKTLFTRVIKINSKHACITANALINLMKDIKNKVHTITLDNGKEFAQHKKIAEKLDTQVYFAEPYSSWQRGINENTNGLLRRYFPKGTDFNLLSNKKIQDAVDRLNCRPRKTRGFKTPHELFTGQKVKLLDA